MKISKIESLCKSAKRITVVNDKKRNIQWISDGTAIYPLFKLPKLTAENIFYMFDIPEEKQGKIYFEELDELPAALDFNDANDFESDATRGTISLVVGGSTLIPFECSVGTILISKKHLDVFDDDAIFFERRRANGGVYLAAKEGLFLAGVILPYTADTKLAETLKYMGGFLLIGQSGTRADQYYIDEDEENEEDV